MTLGEPMYKAEVRVVNPDDGMINIEVVDNIDVDGKFTMDQRYLIPVNDADDEGSVTYLRCVIPEGTHYREGYKQLRKLITDVLGMNPEDVARTCDIYELMA